MSSVEKGNKLEDIFYQFLLDQREHGSLLFGIYPPANCKIFKKKSYYCKEREADVEFDVVIELYGEGRSEPHLHVVFECKNHTGNVSETHVNDFSSKIGRIFPHAVKGVLVVSSRLQSGADKVARNRRLGIVKYDANGLEIVADRKGGALVETGFIKSQIFRGDHSRKSLKFSAYCDGKFFSSIGQLIKQLDPEQPDEVDSARTFTPIPYLAVDVIKARVKEILTDVDYRGGAVDLEQICSSLSIKLTYSRQDIRDIDGLSVLGSANFTRNTITINANGNPNRERFTLGHEIGHFSLRHGAYLTSENIIERDLLIKDMPDSSGYDRLEYQANTFSSNLILPDEFFIKKTAQFRHLLQISDRGHGYIFVDDQPFNLMIYDELLTALSNHFVVSKQAIQIKFKSLGMLTDRRERDHGTPVMQVFEAFQRARK